VSGLFSVEFNPKINISFFPPLVRSKENRFIPPPMFEQVEPRPAPSFLSLFSKRWVFFFFFRTLADLDPETIFADAPFFSQDRKDLNQRNRASPSPPSFQVLGYFSRHENYLEDARFSPPWTRATKPSDLSPAAHPEYGGDGVQPLSQIQGAKPCPPLENWKRRFFSFSPPLFFSMKNPLQKLAEGVPSSRIPFFPPLIICRTFIGLDSDGPARSPPLSFSVSQKVKISRNCRTLIPFLCTRPTRLFLTRRPSSSFSLERIGSLINRGHEMISLPFLLLLASSRMNRFASVVLSPLKRCR